MHAKHSLAGLALAVSASVSLAGCVRPNPNQQPHPGTLANTVAGTARVAAKPDDIHVPDFARKPYEPFGRNSAVQIALREWRLFGQNVDDDPPDTRPEPPAELKPERMPGLWQRVGEYWFEGLDANAKESLWTGKHDEWGLEFPAPQDGTYAWSAAFISYVMRIAGAGDRFPYSSVHADYINIARMQDQNPANPRWAVLAEPPQTYAPMPGDLICTSRALRKSIRFEDLPTPDTFPGHCDIVVAITTGTQSQPMAAAPVGLSPTAPQPIASAQNGMLTVVGGNVDDSVTMKHVPVGPDGMLTSMDGTPYDTRYPWFVVLKVLYDR